jgi:formate dehydrogenase major subunit
MCVVEVDGSPKLAASCVTPVRDGMSVVTSNERIIESRRLILEFLFAERNHNCMFCPQSGDCELQNLAYEMQMDHLTVSPSFDEFPTDITSEYMAFDHNRCVLCGRCVRACQEISGAHVLNFINRGPRNLIGFDCNETRDASTCHKCGACMQVCPTGAINNRYRTHYAVKGHDKKDWQSIDSVCPLCGILCPTTSAVCENNLLKIEGHLTGNNGRPDGGQLCYLGRFEPLKNKTKRLTHPMIKNNKGIWEKTDWESAINQIVNKLNGIRDSHGSEAVFGLASSMCSNETLFLFKGLMNSGLNAGYIDTLDGAYYRTISNAWHKFDPIYRESSWETINDADFIMILGANPQHSHPVIHSLIHRKVMEKKAKVAIVGNGDYRLPFAATHLNVNNGEMPLLVKAILKEAVDLAKNSSPPKDWKRINKETKKIDPAQLMNKIGLDSNAIKNFHEIVASFVTSKNPFILTGEGLTGLKDASGLVDAINLSMLKGPANENFLRIMVLKPEGNSAGAWHLGVSSSGESSRTSKRKGGLLLLSGEEGQALEFLSHNNGVDFLAIVSPYFSETLAEKGDVMIPIPFWMEEDGTYTSLDGLKIAYKKKVVNSPKDMQETWQTLMSLSDRAGFDPKLKTWNDLRKKTEESIKRDDRASKK